MQMWNPELGAEMFAHRVELALAPKEGLQKVPFQSLAPDAEVSENKNEILPVA